MAKSRGSKRRDVIPKDFKTLAEFQQLWDTHSLADYDDVLRDVDFEVDIQRRTYWIALEPEIGKKLAERAREKGISTETLVNLLLSKVLKEAP